MRGGAGDRRRRGRFGPALLGLAALGGALDSINYLAVAEHLPEGRGFRNYDLSAYAEQPPLYPLLLAAASLGVFEPIPVAQPDPPVPRPDTSSLPPAHRSGLPNGSRCVGAVERSLPECLGPAFAA